MGVLHIFQKKEKDSGKLAKDRLKILLISDRISCSPETMEKLKMDIARVISKYMKVDTGNMEIQITKEEAKNGRVVKSPILYANVPILDLKH